MELPGRTRPHKRPQHAGNVALFTFAHFLVYNATMPRTLEWMESQKFHGFACSECNWTFSPAGALAGDSLEEMKRKYQAERDKEFSAHVCAKHPTSPRPNTT
jgi:hypothetical protein